jgi:hypothetical protein
MKYLKLYEQLITDDITRYLRKWRVKEWSIGEDGLVNIDGDVDLSGRNFPDGFLFPFGRVTGNFKCSSAKLQTLKNSPRWVGGNFDCSYNKLTNLEGAPEEVGGFFKCSNNSLNSSLKGGPKKVGKFYNCSDNELTSLEGAPKVIHHSFNCGNNQLQTLEGAPVKVSVGFNASDNNLNSNLVGGPREVGEVYIVRSNNLVSLEGAPDEVPYFDCNSNKTLKSLEGGPKKAKVYRAFKCSLESLKGLPDDLNELLIQSNNLKTLEGCTKNITGDFSCARNKLTTLEGGPTHVYGSYGCEYNKLTNLKGIARSISVSFNCLGNEITTLQYLPDDIDGKNTLAIPTEHLDIPEEFKKYTKFIFCEGADWRLYKKDGTLRIDRLEELIEWGKETGKIK